MEEIGIDISEQYPKGLKTYMGKMGFNYSIIVCARAEKDCPKTFPGVGTRLVWVFDDPRGDDVPDATRRPHRRLLVPCWQHPVQSYNALFTCLRRGRILLRSELLLIHELLLDALPKLVAHSPEHRKPLFL